MTITRQYDHIMLCINKRFSVGIQTINLWSTTFKWNGAIFHASVHGNFIDLSWTHVNSASDIEADIIGDVTRKYGCCSDLSPHGYIPR